MPLFHIIQLLVGMSYRWRNNYESWGVHLTMSNVAVSVNDAKSNLFYFITLKTVSKWWARHLHPVPPSMSQAG